MVAKPKQAAMVPGETIKIICFKKVVYRGCRQGTCRANHLAKLVHHNSCGPCPLPTGGKQYQANVCERGVIRYLGTQLRVRQIRLLHDTVHNNSIWPPFCKSLTSLGHNIPSLAGREGAPGHCKKHVIVCQLIERHTGWSVHRNKLCCGTGLRDTVLKRVWVWKDWQITPECLNTQCNNCRCNHYNKEPQERAPSKGSSTSNFLPPCWGNHDRIICGQGQV